MLFNNVAVILQLTLMLINNITSQLTLMLFNNITLQLTLIPFNHITFNITIHLTILITSMLFNNAH